MRIPSPGVHKAVNLKSPFMICRMAAHAEFLRLACHRSSTALMGPTCNRSKQSASVCSCDPQEVQFSGDRGGLLKPMNMTRGNDMIVCILYALCQRMSSVANFSVVPTELWQPSGLLGQLTLLLLSFSVNRFLSLEKPTSFLQVPVLRNYY